MDALTLTMPGSDLSATTYAAFAGAVRQRLAADEIVLLTTMPRGGLQVCHRLHLADSQIRRYDTELHMHDALAWRTLAQGVVAAGDPSLSLDSGGDTPIVHGLQTLLGVRVESPVFTGYPGVVLALRKRTSPPQAFDTAAEAEAVRELFDQHFRTAGLAPEATNDQPDRQFVFDGAGQCVFGAQSPERLDPQVRSEITRLVLRQPAPGQFTLADERGVTTAVELVRFEHYPALTRGPATFVSIHPEIADWSRVTGATFDADAELSRLAGAVQFMVENFQKGPTLEAIADSVQLSQFHFHRRFSELFGVTPKHLLYDLQLGEAKRLLADPSQSLAGIARHCGFAHQSHFTSRFKQGAGVTPSRWRRLVQS